MFTVNYKSFREFFKRKLNSFYLVQCSISTLPENVRKFSEVFRECRNENWAKVS